MSDLAIRVDKLAKQYKVGTRQFRHDTLKDLLAHHFNGFLSRPPSPVPHLPSSDTIWALKDVSFEVKYGEVLGIIGANGAGKSTLLKILSRITEPTSGRAEIHGRVGSLLEVGTGFDRELTGRENIYLNGAILGMKKAEIDRKFDEIVDFSGVEKFIDTPVKRYSSGMYVRLAFAVAAHFEPEILILDEVLAVGDLQFQNKCLGKMADVAREGRTILFVSHNLASVEHLCHKVMLLKSGEVSDEGSAQEVVKSYISEYSTVVEGGSVSLREWSDRVTNGQARLIHLEITDENGKVTRSIPVGGKVRFSIVAEFYKPLVDPSFGVIIHDQTGEPILDLRSVHDGLRMGHTEGTVVVYASVDKLFLYPGNYLLSPWITDTPTNRECVDWAKLCCKLRVDPAPGPNGDLQLDPVYGKYWVQSNWQNPQQNP